MDAWRQATTPAALGFGCAFYLCLWITPLVTLIGGVLMVVAGGWIALQLNRKATGTSSSRDALPAALPT
jgi:hypothetical protein